MKEEKERKALGLFLCFPGFLDNDRAVTVLGSFPPNETRAPASPTLLLYIFNLSLFLTCDMKKVIYTESAFNLHGSQLYFFYIFLVCSPFFIFAHSERSLSKAGIFGWCCLLTSGWEYFQGNRSCQQLSVLLRPRILT